MQGQAVGGAGCACVDGGVFSTGKTTTHLEQHNSAGAAAEVIPRSFPPPFSYDFTDSAVLASASQQGSVFCLLQHFCSTVGFWWIQRGTSHKTCLVSKFPTEQSRCARHCPCLNHCWSTGFYKSIIENMKDPGTENQLEPWSRKLPGTVLQSNPAQEGPKPQHRHGEGAGGCGGILQGVWRCSLLQVSPGVHRSYSMANYRKLKRKTCKEIAWAERALGRTGGCPTVLSLQLDLQKVGLELENLKLCGRKRLIITIFFWI